MSHREFRMYVSWQCWPLWETDTAGGVQDLDPRSIGISDELALAVIDWAAEFDAIFDVAYPPDTKWPSEADERRWVDRGRELAVRIEAELGPHVRVKYEEEVG